MLFVLCCSACSEASNVVTESRSALMVPVDEEEFALSVAISFWYREMESNTFFRIISKFVRRISLKSPACDLDRLLRLENCSFNVPSLMAYGNIRVFCHKSVVDDTIKVKN